VGVNLSSISRHRLLPQRTTEPQLFLFDEFQFALPPDWNAIILLRKVGIGPVGARPLDKRELPP
jgi:hypothetical protein